MMKSWADHCSSDEDTDDNHSVESEQSLGEAFTEKVQVEEELPTEVGEPEQQNVRTYDFPDRPPFTAFVGNLSYDIQESSQLQQALADVVFDRLGQRVNVLGGRISYERNSKDSKQHRGFGYVELETLEELKIVMKLNDDGQAMLAGRKIQVDTANHHNRPNKNFNRRGGHNQNDHRESFNRPQNNEPFEKVDGTKFRGGKYNNKNNNSFRNSNHNNNSFRNSNHNNNNNSFNNSSFSNGGDAPRQRPSLKLAPRSKPVDGGGKSLSSDIFGGAKARDEQTWEKSRQRQEKQADEKKSAAPSKKGGDDGSINKKEQQDRRQSGRGGGRGAKGRGNRGGRGDQNPRRGSARRQSHQQSDKKQDKRQSQTSPEEKATAAAKTNSKAADTTPSNPEPKAPKNKFLLLMDDSDSD